MPALRRLVAAASAVLLLTVVVLYALGAVDNASDDLLELLSAAVATVGCAVAAAQTTNRSRWAWAALATAAGAWTLGETIWSVYELGLSTEVPFPSLADVGFLLFPPAAMAALLLFPARASGSDRRRMLFDGATAATALTLISWSTTLGAVFEQSTGGWFATTVSLAYPVSDIALLVVCLLVLSRARGLRGALALVAGGLVLMAVSDSVFAYETAQGSYHSGALSNLGWYAAFALLAIAPATTGDTAPAEEQRSEAAGGLLPYIPLTLAAAIEVVRFATGHNPGFVESLLAMALVALVLVRQALTVRDNRLLAVRLSERERDLHHQAFHDGLTGLANRALYVDRVTHALELHRRDGRPLAICFIDLDGFKLVNDLRGHSASDDLLVEAGRRFASVLSQADTLARFGGDEFAVLVEDNLEPMLVASALLEALHEANTDPDAPQVSASIGVARVSRHDPTPTVDELLSRADLAMYAVKRNGKSGVLLHTPTLELEQLDDLALSHQLALALSAGDVHAVFQPVVSLATGKPVLIEALARWTAQGSDIPAERLARIADKAGLLDELFRRVLDLALTGLASWQDHLVVSVNIGASQLRPELINVVADALDRHRVPGSRLLLELTGTEGLPAQAVEVVDQLHVLGVALSVDDFGTGSATFAGLRELPIDQIKIDRSCIAGIDRAARSQQFVRAVLAFADQLGISVVAEGIETAQERLTLTALGCQLGQGYLFSRPAHESAFAGDADTVLPGQIPMVPLQSPTRDVMPGLDASKP